MPIKNNVVSLAPMTAMGAPQRTRSIASSDFIPNFSLFLSPKTTARKKPAAIIIPYQ